MGFFLLARRRSTELRLPAISRDGSSPSNGNVFNLGKYQNIERWIECMDDAAEPLGPVLVFREKYQPVAAGLFPLLAKMKRQHAERRGR